MNNIIKKKTHTNDLIWGTAGEVQEAGFVPEAHGEDGERERERARAPKGSSCALAQHRQLPPVSGSHWLSQAQACRPKGAKEETLCRERKGENSQRCKGWCP